MELRQLEYFLMVSKLNSFTRAAEQLFVSQPAVTNAIRSLEDELGIQLFDRSQKLVVLTTEGRVFYNHVENVMQDVSKTIAEVNDLKNLNSGTITIGLLPIAAATDFLQRLASFHATYPSIKLIFVEEGSLAIQKRLLEDELDIGMLVMLNQPVSLDILPLGTQELQAAFAPQSALVNKPFLTLGDLAATELVLLQEDCLIRQIINEEFQRRQLTAKIAFESNHLQTIKSLLACSTNASILPAGILETEVSLCHSPLSPPLSITLGLARKRNKRLSHATQALLNFIQA